MRDMVVLVHALGYQRVRCVVGHDFGAVTASFLTIARPDMFESVVFMAHPFNGSPTLPFNTANGDENTFMEALQRRLAVHADLARLQLKHYQNYYSTSQANYEMLHPPEGLHTFLRRYYHLKSASWEGNNPHPLQSFTAAELAQMPSYYIMPLDKSMPAAIAPDLAGQDDQSLSSHSWLTDADLDVYTAEFSRVGFQGSLNWYRVFLAPQTHAQDADVFAGRKINVPCAYASGSRDWGTYQVPGALEKMIGGGVCSDFREVTLSDQAGHFMPQEDPETTAKVILNLAKSI